MYKFLKPDERIFLLQELRSEKYRKHADRIRVILLLDEGPEHAVRKMQNQLSMIVGIATKSQKQVEAIWDKLDKLDKLIEIQWGITGSCQQDSVELVDNYIMKLMSKAEGLSSNYDDYVERLRATKIKLSDLL